MNNVKDKLESILVIVIIIAFVVILLAFFAYKMSVLGNYIAGLFTLLAAIIAVFGVNRTIRSNQELKNKELLKDLDEKSEWRKELMNLASKTFMTTDDIYRVLASLRFKPHEDKDIKGSDNFKYMTKEIYENLNDMLDKKYNSKIKQKISGKSCFKSEDYTIYLEYKDSEIIRLYTKYLLKHHWETNIDEVEWKNGKQQNVIKKVKELRDEIE
ncbi:hypothetical protein ACMG5R_10805 [Staphylococcus warneri]|uniref:hypothetical protein n=1 Tax=Staphylococcus warneri TaxID=1292 RepID=UPI003CE95807